LAASDAGGGKAAAVPGALVDCDDFDWLKFAFQINEGKFHGRTNLALDGELEGLWINRGWYLGEMVTDEKRVVRRQQAVVKDRKRCFELRWPAREKNKRPFLREFGELARAVGERQRNLLGQSDERVEGQRSEASGAADFEKSTPGHTEASRALVRHRGRNLWDFGPQGKTYNSITSTIGGGPWLKIDEKKDEEQDSILQRSRGTTASRVAATRWRISNGAFP
jgi:hypothetical protein